MAPGWTAVALRPLALVAAVELDREQDVGGLRTAVGRPCVVRRALEIRIVEIDVGNLMAGRRQIDEPRAGLHQRRDAVDQHEMAEVVGPELRLEPVRRLAEWRRHDARVGDDEIEAPPVVDQRVGASAHAFQRRQVELDELKAAAVGGVGAHRSGRRLGLGQIARSAHHFGAVSGERARRLDAKACRHARHQRAFSTKVHALERLVCGGCRAKGFRHDCLPIQMLKVSRLAELPEVRSRNKRRTPPVDIRRVPPLDKRRRDI